jgi:transposase
MIDRRSVFEIHRLKDAECSERQIARQLRIGRKTVRKYLDHPERTISKRKPKASKLDAYREMIDSFLEEFPDIKAPVVLQRLRKEGFTGRITIVRTYLQKKRSERNRNREAFIRFESAPGKHYGKEEVMLRCTSVTRLFLGCEACLLHIISLQRLQPFEQIGSQGIAWLSGFGRRARLL